MKNLIMLQIAWLFTASVCAQKPFAPGSANTTEMNTVDSASTCIYYAMNATDINDQNSYFDFQKLEIGTTLSKYYSYFVFNSDSLTTEWRKKNPQAQSIPTIGFRGREEAWWSEYKYSEYVKDFTERTLTEYMRNPGPLITHNSRCTERIPVQSWKIESDTSRLLGYICQKAICNFRGRSYTAWFTTDIPIENGPWKFGGLPGLILKIYDIDRFYTFECVRIESPRPKHPIKLYDKYNSYPKIERQKLLKFQKDIHDNFVKMIDLRIIKGNGAFEKSKPYKAMELE